MRCPHRRGVRRAGRLIWHESWLVCANGRDPVRPANVKGQASRLSPILRGRCHPDLVIANYALYQLSYGLDPGQAFCLRREPSGLGCSAKVSKLGFDFPDVGTQLGGRFIPRMIVVPLAGWLSGSGVPRPSVTIAMSAVLYWCGWRGPRRTARCGCLGVLFNP